MKYLAERCAALLPTMQQPKPILAELGGNACQSCLQQIVFQFTWGKTLAKPYGLLRPAPQALPTTSVATHTVHTNANGAVCDVTEGATSSLASPTPIAAETLAFPVALRAVVAVHTAAK